MTNKQKIKRIFKLVKVKQRLDYILRYYSSSTYCTRAKYLTLNQDNIVEVIRNLKETIEKNTPLEWSIRHNYGIRTFDNKFIPMTYD